MDFRIPEPGSASWLKAIKEALKVPSFKVTAPTHPEAYEDRFKGEALARVRTARVFIESASLKEDPIVEVKPFRCTVRIIK